MNNLKTELQTLTEQYNASIHDNIVETIIYKLCEVASKGKTEFRVTTSYLKSLHSNISEKEILEIKDHFVGAGLTVWGEQRESADHDSYFTVSWTKLK